MIAQHALILILAQLVTATAEDHLRPSEGVFAVREAPAYELALARAFSPSDEARYAKFVAVPINGQTISAALSKVVTKVERKTAPLDAATARALSDTWNVAIDQVRYGKKGPTNDGISYYFADATEQFRAGRISTPTGNTRMAELVSLGELLFSYAWEEGSRDKAKQTLLADANRLKGKLRAKP